MPTNPDCPFCDTATATLVWESDLAVAFRDRYPVSEGHTLVVPRRHVETYFDASPWEQQTLWQGVDAVKRALDDELAPDGYNVGFNAGRAAGQTVMHLHVHVIPRFAGDMADPRGGVRGVIPSKQAYDVSSPPTPATGRGPFGDLADFVPGQERPFLPVLKSAIGAAEEVDIVSAFVQPSGLKPLTGHLEDALHRGARVRVLTGDYLNITHPVALQQLYTLSTQFDRFEARIYRVPAGGSFHPKAYIFATGGHGVAFVGSSNLSEIALTTGVEWNLRTSGQDPETFPAIWKRFAELFDGAHVRTLDASLVEAYQSRVRFPPTPEPSEPPPKPRDHQAQVLGQLERTRDEGYRRGLVVMATGLGKTFLSAFDFAQQGGRRALFVAHREEILRQAAATWQRVLPDRSIGFLRGGTHQPDADLLFASVQTLSRVRHLRAFAEDHFDYVVIDEFHHAAAASYRKLLAHFRPDFLLGLTATPDRLDGAQLLHLCDDNLVARVGLVEGIARKQLVPFRYFGVKDCIDYETIPWRSGRFDSDALTQQAATLERAQQALDALCERGPTVPRALVFCCSTAHADFMAGFLSDHGVRAAAVHSGSSSAPRQASLERLQAGDLDAIVAVDIFNEGVDLPDVNTILMLRPTESPVIFLQQLGRGLRLGRTIDKPHLVVIDFIGNHRSFLVKPQALVALTGLDVPPGAALMRIREGLGDALPEGCEVDIELEAIDLLESVAKIAPEDHLVYTYMQLRDTHGRRPTARELFDAGVNMGPVKRNHGTWFHFLRTMKDLEPDAAAVLEQHHDWFSDLMRTRMSRSYKMVCLQVLDDLDALHGDIDVRGLALRCREALRRDVVLQTELVEHHEAGGGDDDFVRRWREMPLRIFHAAKGFKRQWFALDGDRLRSRLGVPEEAREVFDAMTGELVELRIAEHRAKATLARKILPLSTPIELTVSHTRGNPILRFDRSRRPDVPDGDTVVTLDGEPVVLHFRKIAVNKATSRPGGPNVLPALMRRWFGPTAGQPGTRHRVELVPRGTGWELRPRVAPEAPQVIPLGLMPYYSELAVACGVAAGQVEGHDTRELLSVETSRDLDAKRHFIVRADGESMSGGVVPIRDGDLVLCEWATVTDPKVVEGRPVLLTGGAGDEVITTIKVPVRADGAWVLRSTNPTFPDQPLDPGVSLRVVAQVLQVVHERTDPVLWGLYDRDGIARMFGHRNNPSWRTGHRDVEVAGEPHTILMVNLRKAAGTPLEHRYADRFLSQTEFQWESQATTRQDSAKGRRVIHHADEGRTIHLFVRYQTKDDEGKGEPYVYCGRLVTRRWEGDAPVRVWFDLETPLPDRLFRAWSS